MYNKSTKFNENRWGHFSKNENLNFFLCGLPLILRVDRKPKKWAKDIYRGTLGIECERDRPVGSGAKLGDATDRKLKTIFLVSGIFPGKAESLILLGFECTINPQIVIKIVKSHFWENQNF